MSIQVEMPKLWILKESNDSGEEWFLYHGYEPFIDRGKWHGQNVITIVKVTGFTGDWKDSLHQWNGTEWEKVK